MIIANIVKKSFAYILVLHSLLLTVSMAINGISIVYFQIFLVSLLLFGPIVFLVSIIIKNSKNPWLFVWLFFFDIFIIICFIYSVIGQEQSILLAYFIWIAIPFRNIFVFFLIRFNTG